MSLRTSPRASLRIISFCRVVALIALLLSNVTPSLAARPGVDTGATTPPAAETAAVETAAAPTAGLTATETDQVLVDQDGNGRPSAGDTLRYTVTVTNTLGADAADLALDTTLDPNTTLVPNSLRISPLAFGDSFSAFRNTPLTVAAPGVLINDTGTAPLTAQPVANAPTTAGGTVTIAADGSFTYTPPADYTGPDSFTYSASNSLGLDTATVSITAEGAPLVSSTTPISNATDVPANANIVITFSEPVNLAANAFALGCPAPVLFAVTPASPATAFTLDPVDTLPVTMTCTVTVTASLVTDADTLDPPDTMAADYSFSFTTTDAAPEVSATTPANGATNVAVDSGITVDFSENVNATTSSFTLNCGSGAEIFTLTPSPANSFTLTPGKALAEGLTCTVTVVAAQVTDTDTVDPPNAMAADYSFTFTTDRAPTVTTTTPVNGASDVATNGNITVNFSESVNATTSSFTVDCGGAQTYALSASPSGSFTLNPTSDLPVTSTCTVTVVAAQVTDADAGDPPDTMAADYSFSFTTTDAAPEVSTTTPANGATNVATNSDITVNFSESVNATTSSFTLTCGSPQTFALSTSPAGSFTLDPASDLPAGGSCTVTVIAAQVTDADAIDPPNTMLADYTFTFSTDAAPTVASTSPANGATNVAANANIVVNFSESVNATTSSFTVDCGGAQTYALSASPSGSFTLNPTADLPGGATCTVTVVAAQVTDADANDPPDTMVANYVFSFTTDAAPTVTSTSPANGATNVAANANIVVNFSESVNATTSSFTVDCGGAQTYALSASPSGSFTLNPTADLPGGATCTVTVVAAQVSDADANDPPDTMAADYVFSFTTDAAPTVTSTAPANGATNVATDANIVVNFSESVNATTSSFTVGCGGTQTYALSASPAGSFTLNPTADLPGGATCTVTVVAAQVTDADANDPPDTMVANYVFSFTTDAAPTVTSTTPVDNAVNVSLDGNIVVDFSESVNATTSSFTVDCGGTQTYALSASPAGSFTLNPTSNLPINTLCTVTVIANQVTDADANDPPDTMVANYVFSFTTVNDNIPAVTATLPSNGATGVAIDANITIDFNESVNATGTSFTVDCGGAQSYTLSASPASSFTLDPDADLPGGATCTVTVVAANITDQDAIDPPDTMAANYVFSFSTDAAPTVTSTSPANGATNVAANANIVVNFSESVNATTSSFTVDCGGAQTYALSASPSGSFTLNPTADLPGGATCTVTVVAAQVTDADANDPPDNMVANYVFSFTTDAAPTVTSTSPVNGATNAATDANIVVNFSESVNATTSSFTVNCGGTQTYALSASPSGSFTLNPTADLPMGATCTVTVVAAQVTDADANDPPDTMVANYVFSFTTDAAPTVTSTSPTNGATNAATDANIVVNFSESVNATTSSFTVDCGGTQTYALSASPAGSFTLNPTVDLPGGATCTVTVVAAQVSDADANDPPDNMVANYVFSFSTDAAPTVTSTAPANGATNVATNANIVVNFSESVNATTSSFTVDCGGAQTYALSASPSGSFTLNPTVDLPGGATCTVTVVAAQVTDADANDPPDTMAANYVFSFTTDAAPTVTSTAPANGATNVAANANIVVNFSESVNATTSSFTVNCGGAQTYALSASPAGSFTLNPTVDLPGGATCTVTVVAAQVTDADANDPPDTMAADYVFSFTTDAAPTVTSTSPTNGATNAATNVNIVVNFSESVNATTSSFTVDCGGTQTYALSASPAGSFTLNPTADLPGGATCTVTVIAAQVTDADTNDPPDTMVANYVFSFTTDAAPTVTSTSPTNGATNVAAGANIVVNFSESVNATTSSFTVICEGTGQPYVLSASPSGSFTLNPTGNLPEGGSCTVTVVAAQVTDADANDPPDNMVANYVFSFIVAPDAVDDAYAGVGNTLMEVSVTASGVPSVKLTGTLLDNDISVTAITASAGTTSANGGTVTVNPNGSFSYTPPVNFTGIDSFTYTITAANGGTDSATVQITLAERVWYVRNNAAGGGDGRSNSPFNTLAAAQTASSINDHIFVHRGDGTTTNLNAGIVLKNGQRLIGEDVELIVGGFSLHPDGVAPVIGNGAGSGITLASNNTVRGLTVGNTTAPAITGNAFGTLTLDTVTVNTGNGALSLTTGTANATFMSVTSTGGTNNVNLVNVVGTVTLGSGALSGATSHAFNVNQGTATISYAGTINNSAANSVRVTNKTAGTVTFSGAVSGTGAGVFLDTNTGATINFSGGLTLNTGTNAAFTATGGGTVSATQNNTSIINVITTTSGTGLNIANTTIGASGVTFRSITAGTGVGSAGTGIILDNTGISGGLTVAGNGSTGSGGTIQHKTGGDGTTAGIGIYLNNTRNVSLSWMQLNDFDNFGIRGTNVTNFTLASSTVSGTNGTNTASREGSVIFDNLLGTNSAIGVIISGAVEDNLRVENTSGMLTAFNLSNCTIQNNSTTSGNIGFRFASGTSATNPSMTGTVSNCTFQGNRTDTINVDASNNATVNITISNNTIVAGTAGNNQGNLGINVTTAGTGTLNYSITNNKIGTDGTTERPLMNHGINVFGGNNSLISGVVKTNTIVKDNTSSGFGIRVFQQDNGAIRANIDGNAITKVGLDFGIDVTNNGNSAGASTGTVQVAVKNNNVSIAAGAINAIRVRGRRDTTTCAAVSGNTATTNGGSPAISISQANTAIYNFEIVPPPPLGALSDANAQTELGSLNPGAVGVEAFSQTGNSIIGVAVGSCNLVPPLLAAQGEGPGAPEGTSLTAAQLDAAAAQAIERWVASGLSEAESAKLKAVTFTVADLEAGRLGETDGLTIVLDRDAAGWGWFADATPTDDAEFAAGVVRTEQRAGAGSRAHSRMDLLTVVMHELGHVLGHEDLELARPWRGADGRGAGDGRPARAGGGSHGGRGDPCRRRHAAGRQARDHRLRRGDRQAAADGRFADRQPEHDLRQQLRQRPNR